MKKAIQVRGARQHNLKGIDLDIPHRTFTAVTGPSGSGKSSLVFDTIFAEAQRRYVESLSSYAKQFLDRMEKPDVESVEGISPAVAIQQKNPTKTSRSTVGTATEAYDYLRLLWARVGRTVCPECQREVRPDTVSSAVDRVGELPAGRRIMVAFPLPLSSQVTDELIAENLRALGFIRVIADGREVYLGEPADEGAELDVPELARSDELLVVVDRLKVNSGSESRLADSLGTAFSHGEGEAVVLLADAAEEADRLAFTERFRCAGCGRTFPEPTPALFSFNSPVGACPTCNGFGATLEFDLDLIVPDPDRPLADGAIDPWTKPRYDGRRAKLRELAAREAVSLETPWAELPEAFREIALYGGDGFEGVLEHLQRLKENKRYKRYIRVFVRQYQTARTCPDCDGTRLLREAINVRVGGRHIAAVSTLPVAQLRGWLEDELELSEHDLAIAGMILQELTARVGFLDDVGLGYLTLDRQARTLSGGEAQRINLANSLGSRLVDTTYVLDEPSIGLHPRDTDRLYRLLERLRDAGNTVLVVEHDPAAIRRADHVVELGPASGERGGELVYEGDYGGLLESETLTGEYLSGGREVPVPGRRRPVDGPRLVLEGARLHNLDGIDVAIPLGALTVVTGVSGSGKSTLVHDVLYRALEEKLAGETSAKQHLGEPVGEYRALKGSGAVSAVVLIDQSPIGRTPRSNPVTYLKAYGEIRRIFAEQPEARRRELEPRHFSFNVKGGRCEECQGAGHVEVEMLFLADVHVPCDVCGGSRFRPETLEVRYRGLNIHEVLQLTVDEAIKFFIKEDRLGEMLWQLQRVGLGYLRLGQPATTLSGGEAQRLKLARELAAARRKSGRKLYLLDEPTTGLHLHDIEKLVDVLDQLIEAGNGVVVIEHNLDVIKQADWIIDLGPEAGDRGGRVVAMGRPEEIVEVEESHTGGFLRETLEGSHTTESGAGAESVRESA